MQSVTEENAFVTRAYLSKALLEYMLKLELFPEIHDAGHEKSSAL